MISKSKKMIATIIFTVSTLGGFSLKVNAASDVSFTRFYGQSRYETAVEISKSGWNQADSVVLAYGEDFPDGLTGVTLAYAKDAPILLTTKDKLPQATLSEIQRLGAKNVYILGGTGVISSNIEQQLKSLNYNIERICGMNRFHTAIEVGKAIKNNNTDTVVIATAYNFPDTLSIGPAAARNNMPILYTDKDNLTSETRQALIEWNIKKVVISGGTGVVSSQIDSQLKALGISIERLCGSDRYSTSLSIVKRFNLNNTKKFVLAKGEDFPDALSGGALAAKNDSSMLLTSQNCVSDDAISYFDAMKAQDMYLLGGTGAISDNVKDQIKNGTFGNTEGNISNNGYAVKQGDWIYYCQYESPSEPAFPDNSSIWKMKSDGNSKTKLTTANAMDLNIKGNWLYYIDSDSKIYKIMTDGTNKRIVANTTALNQMIIVGDVIYYNDVYTGMSAVNLDGSFHNSFWGAARNFVVYGNTAYFNYMGDNDSIWASGTNNSKLNDKPSYNINVYRDNIYYTDSNNNIWCMRTDGTNQTTIGADKATAILVDEGWIYYSNKADGKLYKMKVDGTCKVKISDANIPAFNIVGDWVVYVNGQTNFVKK